MALSNKATPVHYGAFREKVLKGEIPVCREVSMYMNKIDDRIRNPRYYYDPHAIDGFIKYCEDELTLTDGSNVNLLPTFKLWAEDLLSWFYYADRTVYVPGKGGRPGRYVKKKVKLRLINKQYIIVARGGAKSMYAAFLQSYFLNIDGATTHQVVTAPTMIQAEETMSPIRTAITRSRGPLFKFLTSGSKSSNGSNYANRAKLVSTKKGIENRLTESLIEVRAMSVDKLQGMRSKYNTVDEWLSGDVREDVVGAIEQGASKNEDWIIVAISSEGTVRNSVGDSIKMELMSVLKGEYEAPNMSIWHYKLDDVSEVPNPDMWEKAQPNIGKTVTYDTYQLDVQRAENTPSARNDILAKRFGLPMEGYTYFFTYEDTQPHPRRIFWGMPCALGADLSQGDDFCAFTFVFPLARGGFGVKTRSYITSLTLSKLHGAMRMKYEEFIKEGTLIIMEGTVLDMMDVYDDLDEHILDSEYDIRAFGFDPYNAKEFVERWMTENSAFGVEKVIQGARTESVPLGELKILAEERMLKFDESLMSFTMGNAVVMEDTNGNRKLLKNRYDEKIDNVSAMMNAYVAFKRNPELFE